MVLISIEFLKYPFTHPIIFEPQTKAATILAFQFSHESIFSPLVPSIGWRPGICGLGGGLPSKVNNELSSPRNSMAVGLLTRHYVRHCHARLNLSSSDNSSHSPRPYPEITTDIHGGLVGFVGYFGINYYYT